MFNLRFTHGRPWASPLVFSIHPDNTGLASQVQLYKDLEEHCCREFTGSLSVLWDALKSSPFFELPLLHKVSIHLHGVVGVYVKLRE